MAERLDREGLQVDAELARFIEDRALPASGTTAAQFWSGFAGLVEEFGPRIRALTAKRDSLQQQIDSWHRENPGPPDPDAYRSFLAEIGYLVPEGPDFEIDTANVDPALATIAGPQLVVPVMNARYALNAANARWGSLYDALYGTDAMGSAPETSTFSSDRGIEVIAWARGFLDQAVPLAERRWKDVTSVAVEDGALAFQTDHGPDRLKDPGQFTGYSGSAGFPDRLILVNNGLHIDIRFESGSEIAGQDAAGISDIFLEAAVTTIVDCEDSVAAVDAADKVLAYGNWLGLMQGNLTESVAKGSAEFERSLNPDIEFLAPDGSPASLKGRAVMLVRNVGELMTNPAVLDRDGNEISESLMDAMITVLIARHDLNRAHGPRNSDTGSVYVVKPKLHGPEEVACVNDMFAAVEDALGLPRNTVKIGLMDEERRTSVNLKECIRAAKSRIAFINTGFLDRTGDEMHTAMEAGAMIRKAEMKATPWIASYEDRNVDIGLACGLQGKAQIGKGMWAMPDLMEAMLEQKIAHPQAGASTAWVPSPSAATLHATHYHVTDVTARQNEIAAGGPRGTLDDLLTLPLDPAADWSAGDIRAELENNAQGILGYVVRWVDSGVGCSKVPDINDVALMEDRATCRISSQHMANWLHHGVTDADTVMEVMKKMAGVVDRQNAGDPSYTPMAPGFDGPAFRAACDLVFRGREQPSGYTEPILHRYRAELKRSLPA